MDIKVYGTETSGHHLVISIISDIMHKAQIPFKISEINDITEFLIQGIESVPAIQINDKKIYPLKSNGSFNSSLRTAINKILSTSNYGELPKFLIPIDFSETSLKALSFGHRLATDLEAITQVIHVYRPKPMVNEHSEIQVLTQSEAKDKLDHIVKVMDKDWGSDIVQSSLVSGYFDVGFPVEKILDTAEDNAVELVILGTTGSDNLMNKWIGSVSTNILSQSTAPVLLIPEEAKYRGIPSIMIGIDKEPLTESMTKTILNLCSKFNSIIHLVHIGPLKYPTILESSKALLSHHYDKEKIITKFINSKDVLTSLNTYSKEQKIEIIAIAPREKSIFNKLFDASITQQISKKLESPLLVLK